MYFCCCTQLFLIVNLKDGETPVYIAAQYGRLDVIEYLVTKCKADPDQPNKVLT